MNINSDFPETFEHAMQCYQMGQQDKALEICQKILAKDPNDGNTSHLYGLLCYGNGDINSAVRFFNKATSLHPKFMEAHSNLGNAYREQGKLDKAIASYKKALSIDNTNAQAHYNLGSTLALRERHELAISSYKKAIKLMPEHYEAINNMGSSLREQGKLGKALECFYKVIEISSQCMEGYNNLCTLLITLERTDEAYPITKKWLQFAPQSERAHCTMARVHAMSHEYSIATKHLLKAIDIKVDYVEAYIQLSAVYRLQLNEKDAFSALNTALVLNEGDPFTHFHLASLHKAAGNFNQAAEPL